MVLTGGVSVLTNLRFIYRVGADRPMEGEDLEHENILPAGYESGTQSEESGGGGEDSVDSEDWVDPEDVEVDDMHDGGDFGDEW